MRLVKESAKKVLSQRAIARFCVDTLLKAHNLCYRQAGVFSQWLEADGLHPKHRLMNYHLWFTQRVEPHWTVLDVGCGNGALAQDLAKHCHRLVGIDTSAKNVAASKARVPQGVFHHGDATTFAFDQKFDAAVLSNVLEHIEGRVELLKKLKEVSRVLLIRVPMINRDWITLYKRERNIEYRLDETHFIEYTMQGFQEELHAAGLKMAECEVMFGEIYAKVIG